MSLQVPECLSQTVDNCREKTLTLTLLCNRVFLFQAVHPSKNSNPSWLKHNSWVMQIAVKQKPHHVGVVGDTLKFAYTSKPGIICCVNSKVMLLQHTIGSFMIISFSHFIAIPHHYLLTCGKHLLGCSFINSLFSEFSQGNHKLIFSRQFYRVYIPNKDMPSEVFCCISH